VRVHRLIEKIAHGALRAAEVAIDPPEPLVFPLRNDTCLILKRMDTPEAVNVGLRRKLMCFRIRTKLDHEIGANECRHRCCVSYHRCGYNRHTLSHRSLTLLISQDKRLLVREEKVIGTGIIGLGLERGCRIILNRHIAELDVTTVNLEVRNQGSARLG
jgi:hypothetical protein